MATRGGTSGNGHEAGGTENMVAAVDLGSNSFHMVIARETPVGVDVLDRLRERVQIAAGLGGGGQLTRAAQDRAIACLERFRERLRGLPSARIRAVGTSTLRRTRDRGRFLRRASAALGHPIEVLPGREEGRLIYLGVVHDLAAGPASRRLVVDIGGGSTECVLGEGFEPLRVDSLSMGCVRYTTRFFRDGLLSRERFDRCQTQAGLELETIVSRYRRLGWAECVGASGTIKAVASLIRENGLGNGVIDLSAMRRLRKLLVRAGHVDQVALPGLAAERKGVLPAGLAILIAIFEAFEIDSMDVAGGALREGVLHDLLGRLHDQDLRERTVRDLTARFGIDVDHADAVKETALGCARQVAKPWSLEPGLRLLDWAARLHELGLVVSYSGYHRHGAYLVSHADLPGFSKQDQMALATLIGAHRRRIEAGRFVEVDPWEPELLLRLALLLRLSVRLHRSRVAPPLPEVTVTDRGLMLQFPDGWLDAHPLTRADLEDEARLFDEVDQALEIA
jgi:exopolyphosphatase / guanosine-5'-triphosphate,3'-diphosphate pyrophosphatase